MDTEVKPLLVSTADAARVLSIGHSTVRAHCLDGTLPSVKVGGRRLIPYAALVALAEQSPLASNGCDDPG